VADASVETPAVEGPSARARQGAKGSTAVWCAALTMHLCLTALPLPSHACSADYKLRHTNSSRPLLRQVHSTNIQQVGRLEGGAGKRRERAARAGRGSSQGEGDGATRS